jgi:hypothetical protein
MAWKIKEVFAIAEVEENVHRAWPPIFSLRGCICSTCGELGPAYQRLVATQGDVVGDGQFASCAILHHNWKLEGIHGGMGNVSKPLRQYSSVKSFQGKRKFLQ